MYKGQHLYIKKASGSYTHHALGIGNNRVIQYSGLADNFISEGLIEEVTLDEFAKGSKILIRPHINRKFGVDESIIRAGIRLGEDQYHILYNNCEHLVEWCISGKHRSSQSRRGKLLYSAGIGARTLIGVKNPAGFVAGAVAGYAYIHHQGLKKMPDFTMLEDEFEMVIQARSALVNLP